MKIILYDDGTVLEMSDGITICYSDKEIVEVAVENDKEKYKKKLKTLTERGKSIKSK